MRGWLLLAGDWHRPEFAAAQQFLVSRRPALCCSTVAAACRTLADAKCAAELGSPAAVVLAQSWPGQIDRRQIDTLHALAPLARLVGLVGPWSEGPQRGAWRWPGVEVVPWQAWPWRLPAALGLDGPSEAAVPPFVPKTATAQERIVHRLAAVRKSGLGCGNVAIVAPDPPRAEGLAAMVRALTLDATCVPCGQPIPSDASAVLMDGWEVAEALEVQAGSAAGRRRCAIPHILLLSFPRWDDVVRAEALGFAEVLAQPLLLSDLAAALARHLAPSGRDDACSPRLAVAGSI